MITLAIIIGIALIIAAAISFITRMNQRPAPLQATVRKPDFTVTINYGTSFIKTYEGVTYSFINVTIFNKTEDDMEDVDIATEPNLPIVNDLNYRATTENWPVDRLDPVHADTIQARVMSIPAGATVSGYLIVESPKAQCNVDAITVSNKGVVHTIEVRQEKVFMKTINIRRY